MTYYNSTATSHLIIEASPSGLGAVLLKKQADDSFKPVLYASRALNDIEIRHSQTERGLIFVS